MTSSTPLKKPTRAVDDIPPRYENKYLLTMRQAEQVRSFIQPFCVEDENSKRSPTGRYSIVSLYLDTPHLGCWRAWEIGTARRFKLRIRRYGEKMGDSPVFLEVKQKLIDITVKSRALVPWQEWLPRARGEGRTRLEQDFYARTERYGCVPALLVRYERSAWKGITEAYARITFDMHLQFQVMRDWSLMGDPAHWVAADNPVETGDYEPRVLLEVKFERDVPKWIVHMLRSLELDRRGFSKYGVGIRRSYAAAEIMDASRREPIFAG